MYIIDPKVDRHQSPRSFSFRAGGRDTLHRSAYACGRTRPAVLSPNDVDARRRGGGVTMRRLLVLSAVIAGVLMTGCSTASSGSAGPKPVTCGGISGSDNPGATLALSGCTGPTGGSGTVAAPFFAPSTIHWASGRTSTVSFNPTPRQVGNCPTGSMPFRLTGGTVTSPGIPGATGTFNASFCIDAAGDMSLQAGTLMRF
jgi:hypothetical protein